MSKLKSFAFMSERKLLIITLMAFFLSMFVAANVSSGSIAFDSNRDGNFEIYVMNKELK